ncbi:hypothetical protein UFOVP237_29 [uncultured Caudovirales phage]|uniref:Uncharacterized protein n=1 Tax=uncultured Caudovirales phage TaxID=2100421 RepID=A0A6J7WPJ3_9CAUD|nr:hypothetical protein UFOVP237_29 [uncultured Caudovirales phage]
MINKYSLWNIAAFGGGGGGGGGNQGPSSLNAAEGEMSPSQREVSYGGGGNGGNNAAAQAQAQADAQAQIAHEAAISQPPATTSFTTAAFPGSIVPTGGFTSGYPNSNGLTDQALSGANSGQVASQAIDAMGAIPSPQMAADLAAMGGIPAPGTPMPTARPDNLGPEYSKVDFSGDRSLPSFAREFGTGQTMTTPGGNSAVGTGSPRDYNTAQQAFNQAVQNQDVSGYDSLMASSTGQPASTTDIMNRIVDLVVPKAQAEDTPPTNTVLPGNVPLPPARPVETAVAETPPAPAPAPIPMPTARPDQLNWNNPAPTSLTPAPSSSPFEDTFKKIVDEAPKNLANTAVGFIPGVGLVNTVSGLVGGPTVGGAIFPGNAPTASTSNPLEGLLFGIGHALGDLFGTNPAKGETINAYETRFQPSVESAINGSYLTNVPSRDWINAAYTGPNGPIPTQNSGHGGPDILIPPVLPPQKTASTTKTEIPTTTNPSTLASKFARSYAGAPKNPLRYGYGPEANYYTTAAKGGMISPLNRMRDK